MITESKVYTCRKCQSNDLVKNGTNASGSSQYHCKTCGAYGVLELKERSTEEKKELIIKVVVVIFEVIPSQQWAIIRYYIGV